MIEGLVALVIACIGAAVVVGQMKESAKANKEAIKDIKDAVKEYQEAVQSLIEKNMQDVKDMLDAQKENQDDALSREIGHIKETLTMNISEIRDDIRRLENSQTENAKLREEVILLRSAVKSLHKRLDMEVPEMLKGYED